MKVKKDRGDGVAPFVFDPGELTRHYRRIPHLVLADLNILCFGDASTFDPDPYVSARNQGRHEVWRHINNYLKLTPEQVEAIYEGRGHLMIIDDEE